MKLDRQKRVPSDPANRRSLLGGPRWAQETVALNKKEFERKFHPCMFTVSAWKAISFCEWIQSEPGSSG